MIRTTLLATALALTALTPALAVDITPAEREACKVDYEAFCRGTFPGGGRIIRCLASHYEKLTPACKKIVDAQEKK